MFFLYAALALAGGTLLVCQVVLTLVGLGGDFEADFNADAEVDLDLDMDVDADADGDGGEEQSHGGLLSALSLRAVTAAATFAGLGGLIGSELRWPWFLSAAVALAGGAVGLLAVGWAMRQLHRLSEDNTVSTDGVAGTYGTVYVRVPAERSGLGKVQLEYRGRTVEMAATTDGPALPSGAPVVVRAVTGPDTADVAAV